MVVDTTMDTLYLDSLDEYVKDEGRIVTYKWLSLMLEVNANVAKQMLYHYVTKQRSADKEDNLNVTYMVSGIMAGEGQEPDLQKMVLVREENLATVKSSMKDIISVHIYSIGQSKFKDWSLLYTANYDEVKKNLASINRYSGIECSGAKVKSTADLAKLQQLNSYQAPPEEVPLQKKKTTQEKVTPKSEPVKENTERESSTNKQGKKGNNQIASMFARQTAKPEVKKEGKKAETTKQSSRSSKKSAGISTFFNKAPVVNTTPGSSKSSPIKIESTKDSPLTSKSSKPSLVDSDAESSVLTESIISSSIKTESQDSTIESQTDSMEVDSSPLIKAKRKTQSKIKPKKSSQKRGKSKLSDNESPVRKRKRIMALSDSDSSDDNEEEEEEESPMPRSPMPEPARIESDDDSVEEIPTTPQPEPKGEALSKNGRPKKRKLVAKTFMDDDGFIVTRKEYEFVSDSDEEAEKSNEENIPAKSNVKSPLEPSTKSPKTSNKKSPRKKSSTRSPAKKPVKDVAKTKQSNIMSFFGKK